jgi:hypothetical protein
MSLTMNEMIENDIRSIIEDKETGPASEITLINGLEETTVNGWYNSTNKQIDPGTGLEIVSQNPSVVLTKTSLNEKIALGDISTLPGKNWKCNVLYLGNTFNYFITKQPIYDNRLGVASVTLILSKVN